MTSVANRVLGALVPLTASHTRTESASNATRAKSLSADCPRISMKVRQLRAGGFKKKIRIGLAFLVPSPETFKMPADYYIVIICSSCSMFR